MLLLTFASILTIAGIIVLASDEKFFRRDYKYFKDYNAFYKLHWGDSSNSWEGAFLTCDDEGSKLFYPKSAEEWTVAASLSESLVDVEGIFVGVRDELGLGDFLSIEGRLIPEFTQHVTQREGAESKCGVMSVSTGSFNVGSCKHRRPFICKKTNDEYCPTVDSAYIYSKETKKCYKINERSKTWHDALHACLMEGGILLKPMGDYESFLPGLVRRSIDYFIGARRMQPESPFYDLEGSNVDFSEKSNNNNNCIRLYYEQNYEKFSMSTYDCNYTLPFICEMQAKV